MTMTSQRDTVETAVTELSLAMGLLLRRLRVAVESDGMCWSQLAIAARLEREGPATTADLARAEAMKPQSMGANLAMMAEDGLVERRPHPSDGRQVLYALTAKGLESRRQRRLAKEEWLHSAVAGLDPAEQETLIAASALIRRLGETASK